MRRAEAQAAAEGAASATPSAWARAEHVARTSYGRLLAILASSAGDIELAEDALGDAFAQALRTWPESGVPDNPEGWLLTVARNRQRDVFKSAAHRTTIPLEGLGVSRAASVTDEVDPDAISDNRLALLFVCAHPAIAEIIRTPLMLQTVLGFEARQIAQAFAVPEATMAQRLVRAKRRIRDARIPFVVSIAPTLGARVAFAAVLGRTDGPEAGLMALDRIAEVAVQRFQPAWATRAHLLAEAGRVGEARQAYERAISLTTEPSIRQYLERRRSAVVR